jgi:CO dehydrogenase/acetyl-CoA synthase epsilon subunit
VVLTPPLRLPAEPEIMAMTMYGSQKAYFWVNTGTLASPYYTAQYDASLDSMASSQSAFGPHLADIDGDGDYDLILNAGTAIISVIRNLGTSTAPNFQYNNVQSLGVPRAFIDYLYSFTDPRPRLYTGDWWVGMGRR